MDYFLFILSMWLIILIVVVHETRQTIAATTYPIEISIPRTCLDGYELRDPNGRRLLKFNKLGNNIYDRDLSLSGGCHGGLEVCVVHGYVSNNGTFRLYSLQGTGRAECNLTVDVQEATTTLPETTTSTELPTTVPTTTTFKRTIPQDFITIRPYRLYGEISGKLNNLSYNKVVIEIFISAVHGRSNIIFKGVSRSLMTSLPAVINEICSLIGWMFAIPEKDNGYTYTDGRCTRKAIINYDTGETVNITQRFYKVNRREIDVETHVVGTVPRIESNGSVDFEEYYDLYHQIHPGKIGSDSRRSYVIGNTSIDYNVSQIITYDTQNAGNTERLSDTTNVSVSKISTFFEPGLVRFRMTSRIFAITGNNMSTRITNSSVVVPETDIVTKYMPFIIGGAAAVGFVIIVVILVKVICVIKARRKHKLNTGVAVNIGAHPAENAEYMEMEAIYEEIKPAENTLNDCEGGVDIGANNTAFCSTASTSASSEHCKHDTPKQQDYESLLVSRCSDEYSSFVPHEEIEPENTVYECEGGVDIRANKPSFCPSASTSADYLTPMFENCKNDSPKQQNYKSLLVSRSSYVDYRFAPQTNGIQSIIAASENIDEDEAENIDEYEDGYLRPSRKTYINPCSR